MEDSVNPQVLTARNILKLGYVKSVDDRGVHYELRYSDCHSYRCKQCRPGPDGKWHFSHGPYWYLIGKRPGTKKKFTAYIGKHLDTKIYRTPEGGFDHDSYIAARNQRRENRAAHKSAQERQPHHPDAGAKLEHKPEPSRADNAQGDSFTDGQ